MNYLIRVTPIVRAIPDELYPSMNAGYEYGKPVECIIPEDYPEVYDDSQKVEYLGVLPEESKIC